MSLTVLEEIPLVVVVLLLEGSWEGRINNPRS